MHNQALKSIKPLCIAQPYDGTTCAHLTRITLQKEQPRAEH